MFSIDTSCSMLCNLLSSDASHLSKPSVDSKVCFPFCSNSHFVTLISY